MGVKKSLDLKRLGLWIEKRIDAIWTNLLTNHLWQRMLKNTLATTLTVILALIPAVVRVYGKAAYLAPITTVFGHPGRRLGMMAEALVLAVSGTLLGIGWSCFGLYLSSLVYDQNAPAAYTIRGLFLVVALVFHGFLRSHTPRLFIFVLLLVIVSVVSLTSTATSVSKTTVTTLLYPILTAAGILLLVNTTIFPEFSSSFLGITTIETLGETVGTLRDAGKYFVHIVDESKDKDEQAADEGDGAELGKATTDAEKPKKSGKDAEPTKLRQLFRRLKRGKNKGSDEKAKEEEKTAAEAPKAVKLKSLTDSKAKLRAKLASCKAAQQECNFELAWAVLPPRDLKPISDTYMKKLVANTIALIGACESKYALMGDEDDKKGGETKDEHQLKEAADAADLESGDESSRPGTGANSPHDDSADERQDSKQKRKEKRKRSRSKTRLQRELKDLELIKPKKEIESGDIELLRILVRRITKPLADLQEKIDRSVDVVTSALAYCYDVPKLPSGARAPSGIQLEEIDIRVDILTEALADFDRDSALALETAASMNDLDQPQIDVMPRMETFLISSFLLNLRQGALQTLEMLNHSRVMVEKRQARHGRHRLYAPRINWRKWLISGGEEDSFALPESGKQDARRGKKVESQDDDNSITSQETLLLRKRKDEESGQSQSRSPKSAIEANQAVAAGRKSQKPKKETFIFRLRNGLADVLEYIVGSEDVLYSIKLTVAVFLVTWPAFLHQWNTWYSLNRGLWAALQLVLITEVAIGTSVMTFALRGVGTTIGCVWGYAAYEARNGNKIVCVVIIVIGIIPSTYIQLGSKYVKAGMVSIISMCIVALATEDGTVPGSATENFLKRWIAFLIGGVVALIVEVILLPVKARDRLVESLAASMRQISEMEACLAYGVETEANVDVHSAEVSARFERAKGKAQGALTAAETFLPFCANEPRLKGSFKGLALVYAEILYVLHAVVDRMDNMLHLRHEYGSGVLEELNEKVYPYRRNVAGAITLVLFACHEALTTKLPLPQFLPSARLAHLRMVNRVREVVLAGDVHKMKTNERSEIEVNMVKRVVRQKFLSWNAASAGQIEVIEYLEELVDLVKLLVGANEFRSGMLTRPTYREYVDRIDRSTVEIEKREQKERASRSEATVSQKDGEEDELRDIVPEADAPKTPVRRRTTFSRNQEGMEKLKKTTSETQKFEQQKQANEEELPRSLQRVRSRRIEEMELSKSWSRDEGKKEGKRPDERWIPEDERISR
ncbi:related to Lactobacillus putative histidine protein kinase SppK [Phialocephala subalpina]|uniref:Related to Lactobacillus putative histidine protein kinase SppK n=1 Tax=Phialocephala subalpina TaxID=576137 RepID=A0A1L7XBE3_9HELO|nr:related to Lactobacillus putative histidine protein kinase SppK [Phialocephala subalpina]